MVTKSNNLLISINVRILQDRTALLFVVKIHHDTKKYLANLTEDH